MTLTIVVGLIILPFCISELIYFDDKSLVRMASMLLLFIGNIFFDHAIKVFHKGQFGKTLLVLLPAILLILSSMCVCLFLLGYISNITFI